MAIQVKQEALQLVVDTFLLLAVLDVWRLINQKLVV